MNVEQAYQKIKTLRSEGMEREASLLEKQVKEHIKINTPHTERPSLESEKWLDKLNTQDRRMLELKDTIRKLVAEKDPVLIIGESGTGKEIIARALHGDRGQSNEGGNFVAINCAGLPEYLIESELFGHERGAFTGADTSKEGLFETAKHGTLFLDEIGDLKLDLQAKLLRAIQEQSIRRVGGKVSVSTFCRIVAATHHNLPQLVGQGKFRLDLYARLCTFPLFTIPVRDRREDIKLIVQALDRTGECWNKVFISKAKDTNNPLYQWHDFPLNVRDIIRMVRQYEVLGRVL